MVSPAVGKVILVPFPFSDLTQTRLRPAVVLVGAGRGDSPLWLQSIPRAAQSKMLPVGTDGKPSMTYSHTRRLRMAKAKLAITLDEATLGRVDKLVRQSMFASRSQAIQEAVEEKLSRLERSRLARECAKLVSCPS